MAGGGMGSLLNKEALKTTPPEALNWYLYFCSWIICTSGGLHGYNSSNISGILAMADFKKSFDLGKYTSTEKANITGWVTSLVGCVIQIATTSSINQVIGARAVEGFASGIATVTGTMYIAEIAPKAIRGLVGAFFNISATSHWQWRTPLLIQMIPGIIILLAGPFIVESPRFLAMRGKTETAHRELAKLRRLPLDHPFVMHEYTDIIAAVENDKNKSISWLGLMQELWSDRTLMRRFIIVMAVQVGFNFSGGNSITYYQTTILSSIGVTGDDGYLFSGIYGLMKVLAVFIYALFCAERFGRRNMLMIGAVINIICVTYVAIYLGALLDNKNAGWAAVASLCLFAIGYGIGYAPIAFGLNGELFPNHLRAKIMSLCIAVQYLINFLLVRFFTNIVESIGSDGPFIIFAIVSTVLVLYIFFALPETKGIAIEHMATLFSRHWFMNGIKSKELIEEAHTEDAKEMKTFDPAKAGSGGVEHVEGGDVAGTSEAPMADFKKSFHLASYSKAELANIQGWVTSVIVLGGVIGALVSSPFNDYLGRKKTLILTAVLYLVGCVIQIQTDHNINQVIGARALEGFAGGISTVTGSMYVAEIAPKAVRGLLGAFFSTNIMLGVALGYWGNYGAILNISATSHWQWRTPLLIQMIPGIMILIAGPFIIESPRFLVMRGKPDVAHRELSKLRRLPMDHPFVMHEYTDITAAIEADKGKSVSWIGLYKELRDDATLMRRFLVVMIVQIGFNFSGGNSITYYQTNILTSIGVTGHSGYLFSGIYGLMKVLSVFIYALFCADRFGRRKMILIGGVINIVCVAWVAIYLGALTSNKSAGWAAVAALCLFAIGYGIGWAPVAFGLNGELFPNHLRAKIMSLTMTLQYLINFLLVRFFTNMVNSIGPKGPFIIFSVVSTAIVIYLFFALPETKGIAIEHMTTLFSRSWFVNGIKSQDLSAEANSAEDKAVETFAEPAKVSPTDATHLERSGSSVGSASKV
ncbi:solute carrier family 2 [Pseudohyphozyma bogoriensis]|nr:solute carrier family 2 [Pseudohyphozyma bogoriensis]